MPLIRSILICALTGFGLIPFRPTVSQNVNRQAESEEIVVGPETEKRRLARPECAGRAATEYFTVRVPIQYKRDNFPVRR